jgi:prophage antirepressor-like protein
MSLLPTKLTFGETSLAIIDRQGEPWLTARDLAQTLGYRDERGVLRLHSRNEDEFTDAMTWVVRDVIFESSHQEAAT